jgi:Uma2 family endonuclease
MEEEERKQEVNEPMPDYGGLYTYADYLKWTIQERLELIKGKVFRMSPAPNRKHQQLSANLFGLLWLFLRNQPCQVFSAPFDVRLPRKSKKDEDITTVVQPDICVICDASKLDDRGAIGAPDIVVEILSPGNNAKELKKKYEVYEEAGVQEYWIVSPQDKTFLAYTLVSNAYRPSRLLTVGDIVTTPVLPGFELDLSDVFDIGD